MNVDDCVFCNIANHSISGDIVTENDELIVLKDILPKAPVHLLVLPKDHIPSVNDIKPGHEALMGRMILLAQQMAKQHGVADSGYKLIFNVGKEGGQMVKHMHLHLLGGKQLAE
ncbi:MAG: histidine triad nucleotide-binding protein [Candidatus Doudnabacteria bacterium]|nr:histidine triad nucleotide-binding protein [Candidatus Doudnabacteria bacterium]